MAYSKTLKMEAVLPSEMSASLYPKIVHLKMSTVILDVKLCSYVERYELSGGICSFALPGIPRTLKITAIGSSETLAAFTRIYGMIYQRTVFSDNKIP
jgi:hypothetical protein